MKSLTHMIGLGLAAVLANGCSVPKAQTAAGAIDSLRTKIAALEKRGQATAKALMRISEEVGRFQTITIDPSSRAFQRLDTSAGIFLVSCQDVQPYLDGYKLRLNIGNISSATYEGFALGINWGPSVSDTTLDLAGWSESQKTKEVSFTETLTPGKWNHVTLVVTPSTAAELSNLTLSMSTNTVSLIR